LRCPLKFLEKLKFFRGQKLFLSNHVFPHNFFESLQKFYKMPFFFKHNNSKLKMSVTWKCFDGIQREEISVSDARNEFRFQIPKALFQWQFDHPIFVAYPWSKEHIINAIITSQLFFKRLTTYFCNLPMFSNITQGSHAVLKVVKKCWISKLVFKTLKKHWIWPKSTLGIEKALKF